jgi:plastocyanin
MRKLIAVLALAALLVTAAVAFAATASAGDPPATKASTRTIQLGDNFFKPKSITVRKGTTLKFIWGAGNQGTAVEHNVTAVRGNKFTNGEDTMRPDSPYKHKVTKSTLIVCTIHSTTMKLSVKVKK